MYNLEDTIVAVSSPTCDGRVIVRISGGQTAEVVSEIFSPAYPVDRPPKDISQIIRKGKRKRWLIAGDVIIDDELKIDAQLYFFAGPDSYTGEDVAEIHLHTNSSVTEALIGKLLSRGLRMAGPGEFTARAYLNGKMDLAAAEAVNEIITGCNKFQLEAGQKVLAGRLTKIAEQVQTEIMDCLSLIEAGLDFSEEDIQFITVEQAVERLTRIKGELEGLLYGSVSYERVIDLPAVGVAGATNAGKSSLVNMLLGEERSVVSQQSRTTRDVLTGELTLTHCRCVLFDCAGLTCEYNHKLQNIIDELAQAAAIEALRNATVVIFCVDVSKTDYSEDIKIRELIQPKSLIWVATKSDLLTQERLAERLARLKQVLGQDFLATSVKTGEGIELLLEKIDRELIQQMGGKLEVPAESGVAFLARHKQVVVQAIEDINNSMEQLKQGNDEVAAMMLRDAYQQLSTIEQHIDEQILERIFSRFCIGK